MTEYLNVDGGTLAYEVTGAGPLVVLAHGIGNDRTAYRFVTPLLVDAGYRVATLDLRGCGQSSVGWKSATRTDIAGDLIALITHLGAPAVLVGHSISGGAATIAAAKAPALITAVVELAPFTRKLSYRLGDFFVSRYRQGALNLLGAGLFGSIPRWRRYLEIATPDPRPADWTASLAHVSAMLGEPGRMKGFQLMGRSTPADAAAQLPNVQCPVLIVEGSADPDWVDPRAEGEAIVAALPAGRGRLEVIEGAGHYPHVQYPAQVVAAIQAFLKDVAPQSPENPQK